MSHNSLQPVFAICADLIFAARIRAAAQREKAPVELMTAAGDVLERVRSARPARILLDLDARWLDGPALIADLRADPELARIPVVAFVSHVREKTIAAARQAGADRILARSMFVQRLPELVRA